MLVCISLSQRNLLVAITVPLAAHTIDVVVGTLFPNLLPYMIEKDNAEDNKSTSYHYACDNALPNLPDVWCINDEVCSKYKNTQVEYVEQLQKI